jgi:hypothetical protein
MGEDAGGDERRVLRWEVILGEGGAFEKGELGGGLSSRIVPDDCPRTLLPKETAGERS